MYTPLVSSTHSAAAAARLDAALGVVACVEVDVGVGVRVRTEQGLAQRTARLSPVPDIKTRRDSRLQREDEAPKNPTFTTARSGIQNRMFSLREVAREQKWADAGRFLPAASDQSRPGHTRAEVILTGPHASHFKASTPTCFQARSLLTT
ncbi:hypothetical protein GGX14DRAFT_388449 [Mycena pura]|uniref:Uncharacterized protein n=1 Tax=Mycena pura TaxID=153505 RepID=A0AAD6YJ46_9AGAR|nr:hypothetical protein GGX14DRAFT_388449 [Mycena pura]